MRFIVNFGAGTFHQPGCSYVNNDVPLEIDYGEVMNYIATPGTWSKACSYCLPLLGIQAALLRGGGGTQLDQDRIDAARAKQESYVLTDDDVDTRLELSLLRLKEKLQ